MERNGEVVGWAAAAPVSSRWAYRGVAESSVYIARHAQGAGVGRAVMEALIEQSEQSGIWTLQTSIFPENDASLGLHRAVGFRVVGVRIGIGKRDGSWRKTVLLERRESHGHLGAHAPAHRAEHAPAPTSVTPAFEAST